MLIKNFFYHKCLFTISPANRFFYKHHNGIEIYLGIQQAIPKSSHIGQDLY